jgi:hypothetical protein
VTAPGTDNPQDPPLASYETSFWAFLEYPVFWIPVVVLTFLGFVGLGVLMFASTP